MLPGSHAELCWCGSRQHADMLSPGDDEIGSRLRADLQAGSTAASGAGFLVVCCSGRIVTAAHMWAHVLP